MATRYEGKDPYVFVSYAHADDHIVLPIIDALESGGFRVWYDARIEGGTVWTTNIANHVIGCECMIAFVSHAATRSKYCNREIHLADSEDKAILPVHLDDSQLEPGMRLMIDLHQALFRSKFKSDNELVERLLREPVLEPCLNEKVIVRRNAIEAASEALSSLRKNERGLRDARSALRELEVDDDEVKEFIIKIEARLQGLRAENGLRDTLSVLRALQKTDRRIESEQHLGHVEDCLFWFEDERKHLAHEELARRKVEETRRGEEARREDEARKTAEREMLEREKRARSEVGAEQAHKAEEAHHLVEIARKVEKNRSVKEANRVEEAWMTKEAKKVTDVTPKNLSEYSWAELKRIADKISMAESDAEGLGIAKRYRLVGPDGRLGGETIQLMSGNEKWASVRIVGFRQDELAIGCGRKAGITFEFADVPVVHAMNTSRTNKGGWDSSDMVRYLNGEFLDLLPEELKTGIVKVRKPTNNKGYIGRNDASAVKATENKLWLLSISEVYGILSNQENNIPDYRAVYDAEGMQYKLYADSGVSTTSYGFCAKKTSSGARSWWWLRSPSARSSDCFHGVSSDGDWISGKAGSEWGVSPGFCF